MRALALCCLSQLFLTASLVSAETTTKPNLIFVMADDLGWTDLGCLGSPYYETPNIDRLAEQGITLTNYCAYANCAPTRAALISGQAAPRTGIYSVGSLKRGLDSNRSMVPPANMRDLALDKITIADALRAQGYTTGMFGKWHLGNDTAHHPSRRGFDEAIVTGGGHFNFKTSPQTPVDRQIYLADFLTDQAVSFIERHKEKPFFLYLAHFAVHVPLQAKPELIARYEQKPGVGLHSNATYAAMIHSLDDSIGRLMAVLDELELANHTLLIFTSDNGGVGGYEVPGTDQRKGITDNAPLRSGKGTLYEGGVRVPWLARWPAVIPPGSKSNEPVVHLDMYPTLVELAGGTPPAHYPLDGISVVELLRSPAMTLEREPVYFHFPGYLESYIREVTWRTTPVSAIRDGDYKLIEHLDDGLLELYNLRDDLGERRNLASIMPKKAGELREKLAAWRADLHAAMPRPKTAAELKSSRDPAASKRDTQTLLEKVLGTP